MTIETVEVRPIELALTEPFEIALGEQTAASNLLVTVELDDGTVGYGEGAPIPPITGDTQASAIATVEAATSLLIGEPVADYRRLVEAVRSTLAGSPSALLAVEMALLDAYCRAHELPLSALFGGDPRPVWSDLTIPIVDPEVATERTETAVCRGFEAFKVKTGAELDADIDRVAAVREAAPRARIKVDANQGWTVAEAVRFAERCSSMGLDLELLEQPVRADDLRGLASVTERTSVPVAADESCFSPTDAIVIARRQAADVLNIKLGKSGLLGAQAITAIAQAANLEVMVGCMLESSLSIHAAAHVVAGSDAFTYVDLDANQLLADDLVDGAAGPLLEPAGPGHGIVPN